MESLILLLIVGCTKTENNSATEIPDIEDDIQEEADMANDDIRFKIDDELVEVEWLENESVEALKQLVKNDPLTIDMSMYGGFEQVGSIGTSLPRDDKQTTTEA